MAWLGDFLHRYPDLAVYLAVGLGYLIGGYKIKGFGLGPVTGSLFAGLFIGQVGHVPVSGTAKSILFLMFMFGIGYSVGPQFFRSLKGDGGRSAIFGIFVTSVGLGTAFAVARYLNLDPGFAAGLLSGGLTESPAIGTASEAINALPLPEAERSRLVSHIAVADAVCYVFGTVGVILFCSAWGPRLLGIDLRAEAEKLEAQLGITRARPGTVSAWRAFELRAYRLAPDGRAVGRTVAEAEALVPNARVFVQRIHRNGVIIEAEPTMVLAHGDIVAISGRREVLVEVIGRAAEEVEDRELLDVPAAAFDVLLTNKKLAGRTLEDISSSETVFRGVGLRGLSRGGQDIPIGPGTVLERGDLLRLVGLEPAVERSGKLVGAVVRPSDVTDFVTLGLAIFVGGLMGVVLAVPIGATYISLSTSVGTLLAGLLVGWLRSVRPLFARIPDGAVSFMTSFGLAAFVAMVGLHAGPVFIEAVREVGFGLVLGGAVVTLTPLVAGLFFGRYVLRMNPLLVLGALAGAQTMTAALAAVQEKSGSPVAVLGYTGAVPFGHILLTTWGTVIVWLIA
jgi:putative transport protein